MKKAFKTSGTCSDRIDFEIEDGIIKSVNFSGGCEGNLSGLARLAVGMSALDAIERLKGISCGRRGTSCPDQLAKALQEAVGEE